MQKACKAFLAVAGRVLLIGFSIQIVLGICWMIANFPGFQKFGESSLYVEMSKSLICDEYEGILYPVLILLARGIEEFFYIPYRCILYSVQIGMAFYAGFRLLRSVGIQEYRRNIWGSLAMLTFPMAMQCHLAVLPDSLLCSCLLLELSFVFDILREGGELRSRQFIRVLPFWLTTALLQPEYLYLGVIPVIFLFLYGALKSWKNSKKRILYNGILIMAFAGMIVGVEDLTQIEGYYGRAHRSIETFTVSRFAWPYVRQDYEFWPEEIKECVSWGQALQLDYYADNMQRNFIKTLEEAVGEETTDRMLRDIMEIAWQRHEKEILHNTAWDVVGYTFAPMVVQRQFEGKAYDSYSGRNYDIMRGRTPMLTKYYLNYGCWWFMVGLGLAALIQVVVLVKDKRIFRKTWTVAAVMVCVFTLAGPVLWYTMRGAGMMDYKKTIAVGLLWMLGMLCNCANNPGIQDKK